MNFIISADLQVDLERVQQQFLVAFLKFLLNFILYLNQTFPEVRVTFKDAFWAKTIESIGQFRLSNLLFHNFPLGVSHRILPTFLVCEGKVVWSHEHSARKGNVAWDTLRSLRMVFCKDDVKGLVIVVVLRVTMGLWVAQIMRVEFFCDWSCFNIVFSFSSFAGWLFPCIGRDFLEHDSRCLVFLFSVVRQKFRQPFHFLGDR